VHKFCLRSDVGAGKGWLFVLIVLLAVFSPLIWKITHNQAPALQLTRQLKGIGTNTPVDFEVRDSRHTLKHVRVELRQGDRRFVAMDSTFPTPAWWKFWRRGMATPATFTARVGRKDFRELQEGHASLYLTATNDSWSRFFRGGRAEVLADLPVRFAPPQLEVLSFPHYVNQGGSELIVFKVSPGTIESGVQAGSYFFRSWPVKESQPDTRLCLFAFPYDLDLKITLRLVARDDAGNETLNSFSYQVFPKKFRNDTLNLSDDFLARVVPPILSQSPEVEDQGSPLKTYLEINGPLRRLKAQELLAIAEKSAPTFLWHGPFIQLGNSKVESAFADARTYVYNGQAVDHQVHLGFDLAVSQHTPVLAANDGTVVYAGYFGLYGNAVIIDHGCGLQSLYGHLSSIGTRVGEQVKRGQEIGRSGQTGLAGGDHLHFSILVDGIFVNPTEWWDPHWIHDRLELKLAPYR
jgi:murein DD-endopeptidase MepM/ murein hydrolase activator NlpD